MGKNYLIIGASSGIGEACAKQLADKDNTLILIGRSHERLDNLSKILPGEIYTIVYDLNDLENLKDIFGICKEKKIKLDGMIYSAGVNADCPIKANQISLMKEAMTVNCFAFLEMGKLFYSKAVSNDGASIVAISSISSITCEKGMAPYSASKAALNAVVKTMAKEFARRRIRVNAILPGGVDTPMARKKIQTLGSFSTENNESDKESSQFLGIIPPEIIADNVANLLSSSGQFTTGELMVIGGGLYY